MLAEPAACTAVVLFKFACLKRCGGNTKGKKTNFCRRKTQHTMDADKHMGDSYFLGETTWIISMKSEYSGQKPSCH
jgi:hypothetical protein